jgi:hypothetical protein
MVNRAKINICSRFLVISFYRCSHKKLKRRQIVDLKVLFLMFSEILNKTFNKPKSNRFEYVIEKMLLNQLINCIFLLYVFSKVCETLIGHPEESRLAGMTGLIAAKQILLFEKYLGHNSF